MLKENHIDIIGLNETRLDENIQNREVQIDGYQILRNDRNLGGGGIAFYVKDSLTNVKVKLKNNDIEVLCLEITQRKARTMFFAQAGIGDQHQVRIKLHLIVLGNLGAAGR